MKRILAFIFSFFSGNCFASEILPWQTNFQEAASPLMNELVSLHNFIFAICVGIVLFVLFLLVYVIYKFNARSNPVPAKFTHNIAIEVIWTVIPIVILVIIAIPSFKTIRMAEKIPQADMTVKVVGHQWYWSYSYPDHDNIEFDSNMIQDQDLKPGQKRLLEVDNRIVVPVDTTIKFLITASDVIHSFAVPALGIKTDAVPGRTNETWTKIDKKGVYYGQCSELCGINHGFMPIAIEVVSKEDFIKWQEKAKAEFAATQNILVYLAQSNKN